MKKYSAAVMGAVAAVAVSVAIGTTMPTPTRAQQSPAQATALPAAVRAVLDNSQHFTVFALGGNSDSRKGGPSFHGRRILRRRQITNAEQKAQLVSAIYRGITDPKAAPRECFDPHHGVRVVRDNRTVDLVICFRCARVQVYSGGERVTSALISTIPEPLLTRALK